MPNLSSFPLSLAVCSFKHYEKMSFRKMEAIQSWVSDHKLTSIGAIWASAIGASMAYTRSRIPLKPSLRLIHARMHAQAVTLAVLSGAAVYHYYDKNIHNSKQEE